MAGVGPLQSAASDIALMGVGKTRGWMNLALSVATSLEIIARAADSAAITYARANGRPVRR